MYSSDPRPLRTRSPSVICGTPRARHREAAERRPVGDEELHALLIARRVGDDEGAVRRGIERGRPDDAARSRRRSGRFASARPRRARPCRPRGRADRRSGTRRRRHWQAAISSNAPATCAGRLPIDATFFDFERTGRASAASARHERHARYRTSTLHDTPRELRCGGSVAGDVLDRLQDVADCGRMTSSRSGQ